jgi:hypothetical protein
MNKKISSSDNSSSRQKEWTSLFQKTMYYAHNVKKKVVNLEQQKMVRGIWILFTQKVAIAKSVVVG